MDHMRLRRLLRGRFAVDMDETTGKINVIPEKRTLFSGIITVVKTCLIVYNK